MIIMKNGCQKIMKQFHSNKNYMGSFFIIFRDEKSSNLTIRITGNKLVFFYVDTNINIVISFKSQVTIQVLKKNLSK